MLQVIPAIDLKGGRCVRLRQGEFSLVETYSEDPVAYARRWEREGAPRIHIVDLDGARVGAPQVQNVSVLRQILRRVSIPVQLGGGIRSPEIARRMLDLGVERVIVGTSAAQSDALAKAFIAELGERAVIGIDARDGLVAVSGWQERLNEAAVSFGRRMAAFGARRIVFTDIARDGMLSGPNIESLKEILQAVAAPVIASGGVGTLEHVRSLAQIGAENLEAVIIGKALYAGTVDLAAAIGATTSPASL